MIENIPILSINVKIWKFCSFIMSHKWRRYVISGPIALLNALQFVFLCQRWGDLSTFILNAFYFIAIFNALLRTCLVIINRTKFEAFMMELAALHTDIEQTNDEFAMKVLNNATQRARKISIFNLSAGIVDLIGALMYPFFSETQVHPYRISIPGVDVTVSPFLEIIYILQLLTPFGLTAMYMPFVNLFAAYAMFGTVLLKIIQNKLRQVCSKTKSEEMMYHDLVACLEYHVRIIRFVEDLNSLVTYMLFVEFLLFSTILCALLFCLNLIDSVMQTIAIIMYIMTMLYVLFTYYWQANELLTESIKVSETAYGVEWYHCSERFKRTLLLFIMRSQKPLMIMLGNMYPMTLETFQSLLNTSYSYFTVLRGVYK